MLADNYSRPHRGIVSCSSQADRRMVLERRVWELLVFG